MSTSVIEMQSLGVHTPRFDLDFDITSKDSPMYNSGRWSSSQGDRQPYLAYQLPNTQASDRDFSFQVNFQQAAPSDNGYRNKDTRDSSFNDFRVQEHGHGTPAGMHSSPAMFTPSNAQADSFVPTTISPMDTHFIADRASPGSDIKMSLDGQMRHDAPSNYAMFVNEIDPLSTKSRCDSLQSNLEPQSPTMSQVQVGRRRGSEYAEPGSARAIYLEKNRKAASKCRTKQKRQQEDLVETARREERKNKILKAEVEVLKSNMRDLMELVGKHSHCPDARLKLYVQREADRLAIGGPRNTRPTPTSSHPTPGPNTIDRVSRPEDD